MKNKYFIPFLSLLLVIPLVYSQNRPAPITLYKNDSSSDRGFHKPYDFSITIVPEYTTLADGEFNLTGWWYGTNLMDWRNIYIDYLWVDSMGYDHTIDNHTTWYYGIKPRKDWDLFVTQDGNTLYGEDSLIRIEGEIDGNSITFTGTWKTAQSGGSPDCFYIDSDDIEEYEGIVTEDDYYVYKITGSFTGWKELYDECHNYGTWWWDEYRTETRTWAGPFAIGVNPLTVDFVDAEDLSRHVIGAAADGASEVVVRVRGLPDEVTHPSQVTVLVGMESGELLDDGWIESNTYTQTWKAPEDFGNSNPQDGRREIFFYIEVNGEPIDVPKFYLYKPPILFVHGIWANAGSWKKAIPYFIENYFGDNEKLVHAWSYPNSRHFYENYPLIRTFTQRAIAYAEKCATAPQCDGDQIVVKKVDIVAHSMGGILSNLYVNLIYLDDVHKLITFGTPHSGSEFANFALYFIFKEMPPTMRLGWITLMEIIGKSIVKGATEDLQVGSPATVQYGYASMEDIPVYAIKVQHSGYPGLLIRPIYSFLFDWDHYLNDSTTYFEDADAENHYSLYHPLKVEEGMFGNQYYSDFIVSTLSQQGGSSVTGITMAIDHVDETGNPDIWSMVLSGLNAPVETLDTEGFSPPVDYPLPPVGVIDVPEITLLETFLPLTASFLSITSPSNASTFYPGENITVDVSYNGTTSPVFLYAENSAYGSDNTTPYTFEFQINPEFLGQMSITAWVYEEDGSVTYDTIDIQVITNEVPDKITTSPPGPLYLYPEDDVILYVEGLYNNTSRDITSHLTGTTYSSFNSTVATVSEDGVIHANTAGNTIIKITNNISINLTIIVNNDCEEPQYSMIVRKTMKFCPGTYFIPYGLEIDMNNIEIDCNGAIIEGNYTADGIFINKQQGVTLKNCTIKKYKKAIMINNSYDTSIIGSSIYLNDFGIHIYNSDKNTIFNNNIFNNGYHAVFSEYSYGLNIDSNQLYSNGLSNNYGYGVYCRYASGANITNNNIYGHIAPNYAYGIKLLQFPNALIEDNNIFSNDDNAIQVEFSNNAIMRKNTIKNNSGGPYISSSNYSLIYNNNFINNTLPSFDNGNNLWDNGVNIGGNYWDDYDEEIEGCFDANIDGYCDAPYLIAPNGVDNHPFTEPDAWLKQTFSLNFIPGWNLISIPLLLKNSSVEEVFKSISYSELYSYDMDWETPSNVDVTKGYWIKVDTASTLDIQGTVPEGITPTVNPGWNLIGHPYLTEQNPSIYSASILSYNGTWSSYIPSKTNNSLEKLKPGDGYWVNIK